MPVFATERGGRLHVVLPRTEWKELEGAAEEYARLLQEQKVTRSRLQMLRNEHEKAERKDASELARWIKDGKKGREPEPKAVEKIDKEIRACERRLVAIEEALDDAESDLIDVVDEHRNEWKASIEAELDAAYDEYAEAVEKLAQVHDTLSAKLGLRSWLHFFPEDEISYVPRGMLLPTLRAAHGDPYLFSQVVSALREDASVHRPEGSRPGHETQRIHEERLRNELEGRGYYTNDELRRLDENELEFRHGAGVRIIKTQPIPKRDGGPKVVDGAPFVAPEDGQ
jgi:hypothetical protein